VPPVGDAAHFGLWPPADLPGLHISFGQWSRAAGTWLTVPTADFRCRCGFTDSAGGDAVPAFVATIHRVHAADCPLQTRKDTT